MELGIINKLPALDIQYPSNSYFVLGFGYDRPSQRYKVVVLCYSKEDNRTDAHVLTVGGIDAWWRIEKDFPHFRLIPDLHGKVLSCGHCFS